MLFYQAMFSVLVADDDPQLLEMVCEAFTRMNANVVRASSGADLIEQLATAGPFDLVVTDISMPWMSGLQAMRATRSAGLATPVIIMTAVRDKRVAARVKSLGKNVVLLRKPFQLSALESAASMLLSGRRSEGESSREPCARVEQQGTKV
jgi:CheY-like chemotaxis protein